MTGPAGPEPRPLDQHVGYLRLLARLQLDNAFTVTGQGGAGTGDGKTGAFGTSVIDEQQFALSPAFATQTLATIQYTYAGTTGTGILEGLSVVTSAVPALDGPPDGDRPVRRAGRPAPTPAPRPTLRTDPGAHPASIPTPGRLSASSPRRPPGPPRRSCRR